MRFRMYASFGLGADKITELIGFRAISFWLGLLAISGTLFPVAPIELTGHLSWLGSTRWLGELKRISDAWLATKSTREKGCSLGFWSDDYLARCPTAAVRVEGRIVAFANLWATAAKDELSLDLMRHVPEAPKDAMEFLFTELMLWGRAESYAWFDLGMAPLAGIVLRRNAPV